MKGRRDSFNFWPAVADFMLTLFVMALSVGMLNLVMASMQSVGGLGAGKKYDELRTDYDNLLVENANLKKQIEDLEKKLPANDLRLELQKLRAELAESKKERERLALENMGLHSKIAALESELKPLAAIRDKYRLFFANPDGFNLVSKPSGGPAPAPTTVSVERKHLPDGFINNPEDYTVIKREKLDSLGKGPGTKILSGEGNFAPGDPNLSKDFHDALWKKTFPDVQKDLEGDFRVNTLLVVGHTDEVWITGKANRNFMPDYALSQAIKNAGKLEKDSAGSNADLGLMRALAVKRELDQYLKENGFDKIQVRCMSASFTVPPQMKDHQVTAEDRRRIEILFVNIHGEPAQKSGGVSSGSGSLVAHEPPGQGAEIPVTGPGSPGDSSSASGNHWRVYKPGQLPPGKSLTHVEARAMVEGAELAGKTYLRGDFIVTASEKSKAVLRPQGTDSSGSTRIIVEYPSGAQPPTEGSRLSKDASSAFEIRDVRRSSDGQVNIFVHEVTFTTAL